MVNLELKHNRRYQNILALLLLWELFVSGLAAFLKSYSGLVMVIVESLFWIGYLWLFVVYPFLLQVFHSTTKEENVLLILGASIGIIALSSGMAFGLFKMGFGCVISLMVAYTGVYLALILIFEPGIRFQYLFKIPYPLLAPLALIEQLSLQIWLIPFIIIHYIVMTLWIGHDVLGGSEGHYKTGKN
ncbi:hypothetical protein [Thermococcus sp.]|uniref:hypothetical protein n=1 Tax=Thermococcus sp. TaxID=35749 RepID=UPI00261BE56E|nr:hypothetical protein [Thermococcus sp.]